MSKLLSLYKLCPINNDILGVSADAEKTSVICTLGKKIVYVIELSSQKQIKSWSSLDNFSSKVLYDFKRKQYVAGFQNIYLKFWDLDTDDINKMKKIKFHKRIYDMITDLNNNILVVYEDGTCESLESALETRKTEKSRERENIRPDFTIENPQIGNGIFSFLKIIDNQKIFCYTFLDEVTLKSVYEFKSFKLDRSSLNIQLLGFTMVYQKNGTSTLITIWSDRKIFKQIIRLNDEDPSFGVYDANIEQISGRNPIGVRTVSENCIAIYASKPNDDGSNVILYNIKYKIIQSKLPFKVFLSNFKLWLVNENLYLSMAQHLSVIPFVLMTDKLSSMLKTQIDVMDNLVDNETNVEDSMLEEAIEFDEDQTLVEDMEFYVNPSSFMNLRKKNLLGAKTIVDSDDIRDELDQLYRNDIVVELISYDKQADNTACMKSLNNVDESYPLMSDNFEMFCNHLQRRGCSETEITNKVVPILIKANRTEDIGLLLKRYNHVSERMLVQIVKYLLTCPDNSELEGEEENEENSTEVSKRNAFLSTNQSKYRDVLSIALCCAFDSTTILKYLSSDITLSEMIQLMDHLYKILSTNILNDPYDMRGNLVESDDFDIDTKLFEWFKLLLDSHYQQILLSKDEEILKKLEKWLELVNEHVEILTQMQDLRYTLKKIAMKKKLSSSRKCNRWYTVEKLELY